MNNNDFLILLQAVLDQSGVKKSLKEIQDIANKTKVKMGIDVDKQASQKAIDSLANSMLSFKNNNSAMTKEMKQSLSSMYNTLINGANLSKSEVDDLRHRFNMLKLEVRDSGKLGKSFGDSIKQGMASFSTWLPASTIIMSGVNAIRNMISGVKDLDTELIDLKKTTNATSRELENFYYESNNTAKQLGVTTKEIISQTSEWSRLGYAIKEAQTMAKNSAILEAISPDLSIQEATDGLVSSLKAYKIEAEDSLDGIISKINIIGNTQAVSNGDIVDILTRSSSAMAAANNSLEQTIALGTAATEITRDASSVGNALKTISMRIRSYDEETESYSEDLENLSGTIADLTKTASTPGGISLFTDETKQTYKSTYDILKEISAIWDELTDKDQADLLEALAGKRQAQIAAAMISNFSAAENSMNSMANSAGNAMEEMEIIYDSLDYKLNILKETGTGISQNLFQRDDMKNVVDGLTMVGEALDFVTDKLGLFGTLGTVGGGILGAKNLG